MPTPKKSFWTTLPGIITGLAAIVTAVTGLVVALNGAGLFNKSTAANNPVTEIKKEDIKEPTDSPINKTPTPQTQAVKYKPVFSITHVKIEDHEYTILGASLEAETPEINSLAIKIRYKNNSDYSPATFWNEGFRLAIDGLSTAPSGELSQLVDRHAEQMGSVTFDVPNTAKELALHILDVGKDVAIPIKLVGD
jgi:hypothetical protein